MSPERMGVGWGELGTSWGALAAPPVLADSRAWVGRGARLGCEGGPPCGALLHGSPSLHAEEKTQGLESQDSSRF